MNSTDEPLLPVYRAPRPYQFVKRAAYSFLKPFYLAKSEKDLLRAHYLLFGFQLLLLLVLTKISNPFGVWETLSKSIRSGLELASWMAGRQSPQAWITSPFLAVAIIYTICSTISPLRNLLAKFSAAVTLWLTRMVIASGQSLMKRRNLAFVCIVALLATLVIGLTVLYFTYKNISEQRKLYEGWLQDAEYFLKRATLVHQERVLYSPVEESWEAMSASTLPLGAGHPARLFQTTLQNLYKEPVPDPELWIGVLREQARRLSLLPEVEKALSAPGAQNVREWSLVFGFLARSHMRSVSDACGPAPDLANGFKYFSAVSSTELLHSKLNGVGTVFACRMVLLLRASESGALYALPEWDPPACASLRECLEEAMKKYHDAADEADLCSFRDKRWRNNRLDLYLKIGRHYRTARSSLNFPPFNRQIASPRMFASTLQLQLEELVDCTQKGEFIPVVFLSSAQAFGVMAGVLGTTDSQRTTALKNAARYLRFSFAWLPGTTSESDFSYFCSALGADGELDEAFRDAYAEALPGVREYAEADLWHKLRRDCGVSNE